MKLPAKKIVIAVTAAVVAGAIGGYFAVTNRGDSDKTSQSSDALTLPGTQTAATADSDNPLAAIRFYVNSQSSVARYAQTLPPDSANEEYELISKIAEQPGTIWLVGPSSSDASGSRDAAEVARTSVEARAAGTTPFYQLYAIPNRDACAAHSKGGFSNSEDYLKWIDAILGSLQTQAVFFVEADAVGHAVKGDCMSDEEIAARYQLLSQAIAKLQSADKVRAVYLDAGHPEWFPDASELITPLTKAGANQADGIVVNVSNFVATDKVKSWSKSIVESLENQKLGVVIDTSRNGNGTPDQSVTGEARWCNPTGRAIGEKPTADTGVDHVHAYVWVKIPGESDGSCAGNPPAGTFVPSLALELARNSNSL